MVLKMSESPERERDNDHKNSGSEIALSEASPRYSDGDLVVPSSAGVEMPPLDLVPDYPDVHLVEHMDQFFLQDLEVPIHQLPEHEVLLHFLFFPGKATRLGNAAREDRGAAGNRSGDVGGV